MRILLSIILTLMVSVPAWATLTANVIPVAKTSGSTPALQNSDVTDVPGISLTSAVVTYVPQLCLNNVCETAWPAGGSQTTGSSLLAGNGSGGYTNVTAVSPMSYSAGNLSYVAPYIRFSDQKTSGTPGGAATTGSWQTRTLNTKDIDSSNIATLCTGNGAPIATCTSANQMVLPAGVYTTHVQSPCDTTNNYQIRLYNNTSSSLIALGTSGYAYQSGYVNATSTIYWQFTLSVPSALSVQYQALSNSTTSDLGVPNSFGTEIYTVAEFTKTQ